MLGVHAKPISKKSEANQSVSKRREFIKAGAAGVLDSVAVAATNDPRLLAIEAVASVLDKAANLAEVDELRLGSDVAGGAREVAFARHLAYGVLRWLGALEWLATQLMKRPLKRRDRDIHRLILLGLFQLWKDESGEHAAINETAECARRLAKPWAVGLINAVLRRFQREKSQWLEKLALKPERFAHPAWLTERIRTDWPEDWESILTANNRRAGLWLRVNRTRSSVDAVGRAMRESGFEPGFHPYAPDAVQVVPPAPVDRLPGFDDGWWSVQDPATQLVVEWLSMEAGQRVLDACAAPGGKTCHILESVPDARVWAVDRSEARLQRLNENALRLGLMDTGRLTVKVGDGLFPEGWWDGKQFDRVLLDAPCTATGVIRRHPEIKWLRSESQVGEAVALQARLLRNLWPLVKAGGILVYATCSVLHDENSEQIRRFIESHGDARPEPFEAPYGRPSGTGCQILPGEADMDGFFYARVRKSP
jgi:16S rRNA (cytosine967-C5)-methyltransferase